MFRKVCLTAENNSPLFANGTKFYICIYFPQTGRHRGPSTMELQENSGFLSKPKKRFETVTALCPTPIKAERTYSSAAGKTGCGRSPWMNDHPLVFASFYGLTVGLFRARFRIHFYAIGACRQPPSNPRWPKGSRRSLSSRSYASSSDNLHIMFFATLYVKQYNLL